LIPGHTIGGLDVVLNNKRPLIQFLRHISRLINKYAPFSNNHRLV